MPLGPFFLVEWYQTGPVAQLADAVAAQLSGAAATGDDTPPAALLMALTMPTDQTVFAVFSAASCEVIIALCQRAGWPPDRISTDVEPWLAS
jgi:hypothetical protein